jgi:hypothetical protein
MKLDAVSAQARQFRRLATKYKAYMDVLAEHASQFRLSLPEVQLDLAVTDVSRGGLGLSTGFFLPKNLRLSLSISGSGSEGPSKRDFVVQGIVRHCALVDYKPSYHVGIQFLNPTGRDERALAEASAHDEEKPASPATAEVSGAHN